MSTLATERASALSSSSVTIAVQIPRRAHEVLEAVARGDGRSLHDLVVEALSATLLGAPSEGVRLGTKEYTGKQIDEASNLLLDETSRWREYRAMNGLSLDRSAEPVPAGGGVA